VLRNPVAIVVHLVDWEDSTLLLCRMNRSRFGRTAREREVDILRWRIAGCRIVVSVEECAHFSGRRVCLQGWWVGSVAAARLGPGWRSRRTSF